MTLVVVGAISLSFMASFVRFVEHASGFEILTVRSVGLMITLLVIICIRRQTSPISFLMSLDRHDALIGLTLSGAMTCFVFSILNTSAASALFIMSSTPFLAAALAWIWIGERPRPETLWIAGLAAVGVLLMFGEGVQLGRTLGNLLAFGSSLSFATTLVLARSGVKHDILGGTFSAGLMTCLLGIVACLILEGEVSVGLKDLLVILAMGGLALGIGIGLVTWASPFVPAAEVGTLVLIESALGPVWVWLLGFEAISPFEMIGGAVVLSAACLQSVVSGRMSSLHLARRNDPGRR